MRRGETGTALKMRQSAAELEQAFAEEVSRERTRRDSLLRTAEQRRHKRRLARTHRRGSLRFVLLVFTLLLTALVVSAAMFASLYLLLS